MNRLICIPGVNKPYRLSLLLLLDSSLWKNNLDYWWFVQLFCFGCIDYEREGKSDSKRGLHIENSSYNCRWLLTLRLWGMLIMSMVDLEWRDWPLKSNFRIQLWETITKLILTVLGWRLLKKTELRRCKWVLPILWWQYLTHTELLPASRQVRVRLKLLIVDISIRLIGSHRSCPSNFIYAVCSFISVTFALNVSSGTSGPADLVALWVATNTFVTSAVTDTRTMRVIS